MASTGGGSSYLVTFVGGLVLLTAATSWAFWRVTAGEVRRSAAEYKAKRAPRVVVPPPPPVVVVEPDTTPTWQPDPAAALADTVFMLRSQGRLAEALQALERWLARYPADSPFRLSAARLAFEVPERPRGIGHYKLYLTRVPDRTVTREAVERIVREMPADQVRAALATLMDVDGDDFVVRIALARATLQAGDAEAVERLLRPVPPRFDPDVDAMRLQARRALVASLPEAERWVAEYPEEPVYRLALARALLRERRGVEALAEYRRGVLADSSAQVREEMADAALMADSLEVASALLRGVLAEDSTRVGALLALGRARARLGDGRGAVDAFERVLALAPDESRFAEARGVLFEVDDPASTLPLLRRLVAWRPLDDVLRLRFAQDLERTQAFGESEAQYDTLLARSPSAPTQLARARVRSTRGDLAGALADAAASEAREPTVDAALLQADIHRWRDERALARDAYGRARRLAPADPRVAEGWRLLAVQRRRALASVPAYGSVARAGGLGDSDGYGAFTVRGQHGEAPFAGEAIVTVGAESRWVQGRGVPTRQGWGGDVGVAWLSGRLALEARAGAVQFEGSGPKLAARLEAVHRSAGFTARGVLAQEPAYETLRAATAVRPDSVLGGTSALGSISAALTPRMEAYAQADHVRLGDGNSRSVLQGTARYALAGPVGVLYAAGVATFGQGTLAYWSPSLFATQGLGLDVRHARPAGLSIGARVVPAYAWIREDAPGKPPGTTTSLQVNLSFEAVWRREGWEVGAFAGYGQDRSGTYAAGNGGLRVRATW
ncbi:MAG: hypothetical protein NW201_03480 [Gemmatimonadales bacterium]|nr:hypothetical protein [Gemmatimonadales bacterium]